MTMEYSQNAYSMVLLQDSSQNKNGRSLLAEALAEEGAVFMDNTVDLKKKRKERDRKRLMVAYSCIAPNFIGFAVFTLIPVVCAFVLAFLKWDGNNPMQFV